MKAVILAGGMGFRLRPLTRDKPKAFLRLAGRRLYEYSLSYVETAGIRDVILVVPQGYSGFLEAPGNVAVVEQEKPGIEGAISAGLREAGGEEVVLTFTGYLSWPPNIVSQVVNYYASSGYPLVMAVASVITGAETYGFVKLGIGSRVEDVQFDRREDWLSGRGFVFAGVMVGDPGVISTLTTGYEDGLSVAARKGLVGATVWGGRWLEIGYPWDLLRAPELVVRPHTTLLSGGSSIEGSAVIRGPVVVSDGAYIGDNTVIRGPAYIGKRARIEDGSVVGPRVIVDDGSVVGPGSVVRETVLMEGAEVGPKCVVEGSVVGEGASLSPFTYIEAGTPERLPERLRGVLASSLGEIRLGAIIAPRRRVEPYTVTGKGAMIE
ncbi:MAG: NDP-sugar synthase [Desulfurococcales archaeon]|nr:NDP-sugar synthase [Desulfurococcales archaeon]